MNPYYVQPADFMPGLNAMTEKAIAGGAEGKKRTDLADFAQKFETMSPVEIAQYTLEHPDISQQITQSTEMNLKMTKAENLQNAFAVISDPSQVVNVLKDRAQVVLDRGGDATETLALLKDALAGGDKAIKGAYAYAAANDPQGLNSLMKATGQGGTEKQPTDLGTYVDLEKKKWLQANPGKTEDDIPPQVLQDAFLKAKRQQADEAGAVSGAKKTAELEVIQQMQPGIERDKALAKYRVEQEEKRAQDTINNALDAAEGTANLRRGIDLLGKIETGGFDNVKLSAKRFFGVEGADEGELSNSLAKAVLSQLRSTFGAAFTEREGARLERIEAGFSKSPENNKRLLSQALKIAQRKADAGLKLAKERGDESTVSEINDWLNFSLSEDEGGGPKLVTTQEEFDSLKSGEVYLEKDPATGETHQYRKP